MKSFILFAFLLTYSFCWWDLGHMLVAQIAKDVLLDEDREAFRVAQQVTDVLNVVSHGKVTDFIESACYADDVKQGGLWQLENWHFINVPVHLPNDPKDDKFTTNNFDALAFLVK